MEANDGPGKNQDNGGIESEQEDAKEIVSSAKENEDSKELSSAVELDKELNKQDIVVKNVEYIIQDNQDKNLYPDMLSTISTNNTDIRDITYAYVAWDRNGLPLISLMVNTYMVVQAETLTFHLAKPLVRAAVLK